jgi:nitrogen fixation NifU-like protein
MPTYSEKVMDHFMNPRNVGEIPDADGVGTVGNPVCGDMMAFYIKVDDEHLADVKFKTFGCGAAIAVSSIVSEMAIGMTLEEAKRLSNKDVASELDGLPPNKMHCSNLGADALHNAIEDYESRGRGPRELVEIKSRRELEEEERHCFCPYCESALEEHDPTCRVCGAELDFCPECGEPLPDEAEECPACAGQRQARPLQDKQQG